MRSWDWDGVNSSSGLGIESRNPDSIPRSSKVRLHSQKSIPSQHLESSSYLLNIARLQIETEHTIKEEVRVSKADLNCLRADLSILQEERDRECRQQAQDLAAKSHWNTFGRVAQYLSAGISIIFALSILAAAPWVGALLLASGVIALTHRAIQDSVGMQTITAWFTKSTELQKTYAQHIETALLIISLGTGLTGGVLGCVTGGLSVLAGSGIAAIVKKVALAIQLTNTGIGIIAKTGNTVIDKKINDLEVDKVLLNDRIEITKKKIEQVTNTLQNALASKNSNDETTINILKNISTSPI